LFDQVGRALELRNNPPPPSVPDTREIQLDSSQTNFAGRRLTCTSSIIEQKTPQPNIRILFLPLNFPKSEWIKHFHFSLQNAS
jgi:hypothetical protein